MSDVSVHLPCFYFIQICTKIQILPHSYRWQWTFLMYLQWRPHYFSNKEENRSKRRKERSLWGHMRLSNNLANGVHCAIVCVRNVCVFQVGIWLAWARTRQLRQLVHTPASVWPHTQIQNTHFEHTSTLKHIHNHWIVPCGVGLQPSLHGVWPVAFTSLVKLLDCELFGNSN